MDGLTSQVARFITTPPAGGIPEAALPIIRSGFIDTIATMLAAKDEPVTRIVTAHVRAKRSPIAEASLLLGNERAPAPDAALINGAAGHALDYDDVALSGHPSTVLVPAILAEGEAVGASGLDCMRAYLLGYETWAELIGRDSHSIHTKGWHPTGVYGTVAAAAAVAALRNLDFERTRHAIALAASMSSGLTANFGTMTKPFHAGRAASNGIEAVRLAMAGLTASEDAFEHSTGGLLHALSPQGDTDRTTPAVNLGREWAILEYGLSIKKYPMCYATHRVIDGMLGLVKQHDLKPEDVTGVHATIGVPQAGMLRNHAPVTGLEAKFSLEFGVASSLVARQVGLSELTDEFVNRPEVREAMTRLTIDTTDTRCPLEAGFAMHDRVVVNLRDGRRLDSGDIRFATGNAKLPMQEAELRAKFLDCARDVRHLDPEELYDRLAHLEAVTRINKLAGVRAVPRAA